MTFAPQPYEETLLEVDLSERRISRQQILAEDIQHFLGGRGVAAHLLWHRLSPAMNPYGPGNPLIFSTGTLTGTNFPMSGRANITFVSPATGQYFKTNVGGHFGLFCKLNGVDYILVHRVASSPVYIWINGTSMELRAADALWGETVRETTKILQGIHGKNVNVTCIGPAGENRVLFASVMTSVYNAAARGGVGAVMGSKNLKAIVIAPPKIQRIPRDRESFRRVVKETRAALYADSTAQRFYDLGTAMGISVKNELGTLPSYNFRKGRLENIEELTSEYWNAHGLLKNKIGCAACIYSCHRFIRIDEGPHAGTFSGGPEYETVSALGTGPAISSIGALHKSNELCNDLGLDTISTGGVIQWLMETYEKGFVPHELSGGMDLRFGSEEAVTQLPRLIAYREGIGDLLADGVKRAAEKIGGESWRWAIQTRGLEQSRVETRTGMGYALAFAINPRGPDHLHTECLAERGGTPEARQLIKQITGDERFARADIVEKRPEIVRYHEDIYAVSDALGLCAFTTTAAYGTTPGRISRVFQAFTGITMDDASLMLAGRRIVTLERLINLRLGWREDPASYAPWRLMNERFDSISVGDPILNVEKMEKMVKKYYELHGWDANTGEPSERVLELLGLQTLLGKTEV